MECVFAQLSCSCGKLARKAGGFLSSLPALKHYSWLTFCASPAKAHETEGSKLLPDRRTDKRSHREDRQTPTAAFCPTWGTYTQTSTMRLCDHWPHIQANLKSQWAADRKKLKCEGVEESIYKQSQRPQLHWGSMRLRSLALPGLGIYKIKVIFPVLLTCNSSKTTLREKLETKQTAPAGKQLLEHGKQSLAKLRCEGKDCGIAES